MPAKTRTATAPKPDAKLDETAPKPDAKPDAKPDETDSGFDFGALTFDVVPAHTGHVKTSVNPFVKPLRDSHAETDTAKRGRAVTVPVSVVKETAYKIRAAANSLAEDGIGAKLVIVHGGKVWTDARKAADEIPAGSLVRVEFTAQDRRKTKRAKGDDKSATGDASGDASDSASESASGDASGDASESASESASDGAGERTVDAAAQSA